MPGLSTCRWIISKTDHYSHCVALAISTLDRVSFSCYSFRVLFFQLPLEMNYKLFEDIISFIICQMLHLPISWPNKENLFALLIFVNSVFFRNEIIDLGIFRVEVQVLFLCQWRWQMLISCAFGTFRISFTKSFYLIELAADQEIKAKLQLWDDHLLAK